jgi:hypothetical protein
MAGREQEVTASARTLGQPSRRGRRTAAVGWRRATRLWVPTVRLSLSARCPPSLPLTIYTLRTANVRCPYPSLARIISAS